MRKYSITEWRELPFENQGFNNGVKRQDAIALCEVAAQQAKKMRLGRDSILSMTHRGLRAGQVVGIVATPYCRLEILPKVDSNSQEVSRRSLFSMIAYTLGLNISVGGYFERVRQSSGILEVLIRRFSEDLYVAVHRGLPRRYLTKEEDLTRLRGQLDTIRQITRFAASPHILATRFDQLDSCLLYTSPSPRD